MLQLVSLDAIRQSLLNGVRLAFEFVNDWEPRKNEAQWSPNWYRPQPPGERFWPNLGRFKLSVERDEGLRTDLRPIYLSHEATAERRHLSAINAS